MHQWKNGNGVTNLQGLIVLLLLFVDYAEPEVYFVGLVEVRLHVHDVGKRVFGMVERSISVIQDADAVPEAGFLRRRVSASPPLAGGGRTNLGVREMDQRSLVCYVGLLEIVHHEVTMSCLLLGG